MILDNDTALATTVAFDLGVVSPGPGEPIKCIAVGVDASLAITHCATIGGTYTACTTVLAPAGLLEFERPSNTKQFIKATFSAGSVRVGQLAGNQTAA